MKDPFKLETLMGLLALTLSWCLIAGEEKDKQRPIKVKSHGRKHCSIFRLGLDYLNLLIIHQHRQFDEFKKFVLIWTNKLNAFET